MSFTFISGTIFDNPALIKSNPKYLSALKAQSPINRARLLDGNWYARPEGSNYFCQRSWLNKLDKVPLNCTEARRWDLASAEPSDKNRYDYTASIKMLKTNQDTYIITFGDYIQETFDELTKTEW